MQKRLRFEYPHSVVGSFWGIVAPIILSLILSIILLIVSAGASLDENSLLSNPVVTIIVSVLTELSFLLVAFLIARKYKVNFLDGTGIKQTSPWWVYLLGIILGVCCLFLLNPIISCWESLLQLINFDIQTDLPVELNSIGNLFLLLFTTALIPAICEEALFRGVILNGLRKYGVWTAVLISATFFSLMHMNLQQLPYTFMLGLILSFVVYYTRNLGLSMIMHFLNNALVLIVNYITYANTGSYGSNDFVWYMILIGIAGMIIMAGISYLIINYIKKKHFPKIQAQEQPFLDSQQVIPAKQRKSMWLPTILVTGLCLIIYTLSSFGVL